MLRQLISSKKNAKKTSLAVVLSVMAFFVFFFVTSKTASALTVSPARIELAGDPGATIGGEFTLINEQSTTQTFYVSYENFSAQGETGTPAFSAEKTGLDTWLNVIPSQITIAPGKIIKVPYTIVVPKDADAGGYFASIFWSTTPPSSDTGQVSIGAKVGILILLRVNGDITESGGITQFDRNGHSFFYNTLPVELRYKFRNDGADRVEPTGTVTIRDTLFIPATKFDANTAQGNILPGSTRQFTLSWLEHREQLPIQGFFNTVQYQWQNFAIGLYSAHIDLSYGTQGLHAKKTVWFFVLPWQLAICLLVSISILWWAGKNIISRYNAYIIGKAQQSMGRHDEHIS